MIGEVAEVEPHVRAVVEHLTAGMPPAVGVSLAIAPPTDPPHLVVYPDPGGVQSARLSGDRSLIVVHFMLHAIALGPEQAGWVTDRARVLLLGDPPLVEGRRTHRMFQSDGDPVDRDDTVQPPLYVQGTEFRWMTQAA